MHIVICRKNLPGASSEYQTLFEALNEACDGNVRMTHPFVMDIGPRIRVEFRPSDKYKICGIRPDYYNADDEECLEYLSQAAAKCNGKELKDLDEIFKAVMEAYMAAPPVSKNNWR